MKGIRRHLREMRFFWMLRAVAFAIQMYICGMDTLTLAVKENPIFRAFTDCLLPWAMKLPELLRLWAQLKKIVDFLEPFGGEDLEKLVVVVIHLRAHNAR